MKYFLFFSAVVLMLMPFTASCMAQSSNKPAKYSTEDSVKITLTIGNKVVPAILYNTPPARDLMKKLPVTVSLNRGPVDYCGGIAPIAYRKDDVQAGYRSGDLAYWIPGRDFVIFTEDKDDSSGTPDLIIIGKISCDIKEIRDLGSTISVAIARDR